MNYESWVAAEKFLYNSIFAHMIILSIIFFFLFHRLLYMSEYKGKYAKRAFLVILLFSIIFSTNTFIRFNKHKTLYDYNIHSNYGLRDFEKVAFKYVHPEKSQETLFEDLYLVNNFRDIALYKEETITEEVDFLGRNGEKFYFQDENCISYRELGQNLAIEKDISTPIRQGAKFYLIDSRFRDIGFKGQSPHTYLLDYKIPKDMEDKKFENPESLKVVQQQEFTLGWINPTIENIFIKFD